MVLEAEVMSIIIDYAQRFKLLLSNQQIMVLKAKALLPSSLAA